MAQQQQQDSLDSLDSVFIAVDTITLVVDNISLLTEAEPIRSEKKSIGGLDWYVGRVWTRGLHMEKYANFILQTIKNNF